MIFLLPHLPTYLPTYLQEWKVNCIANLVGALTWFDASNYSIEVFFFVSINRTNAKLAKKLTFFFSRSQKGEEREQEQINSINFTFENLNKTKLRMLKKKRERKPTRRTNNSFRNKKAHTLTHKRERNRICAHFVFSFFFEIYKLK